MDELRVVGIDEKGYGKVYKIVMRNRTIPLTAKALYAYFCSYAGSGTIAFPHREKIIHDLNITKNTFTKHINYLVDARYISRQRTAMGNIYEILLLVADENGELIDAKSKGYGTIPKYAMLDDRLTVNAKGIYAYLCSYAGSGNVAYPRRNTILRELNIGKDAYYPHYNSLIDFGYITPTQGTGDNGRYTSSTYVLNEVLGIDPRVDPDECMETALDSDSQKAVHGEENITHQSDSQIPVHGDISTDSQISVHGRDELFHMVFNDNSQKSVHGGKPMSQKAVSRETECGKPRHPNINNKIYNKQSSSYEEDDINNIRARTREEDSEDSFPALSRKQVKELVHYDYLMDEIGAWAELKGTLGHYNAPGDKADYLACCKAVVNELVRQLSVFLGRTASHVEHNGTRYERVGLAEKLKSNMPDDDMLFNMVCHIADNQTEIRNLRSYVKQTVLNLAVKKDKL